MFNFKEELAKYRKSLETTELSGGVSGDEVRDILDIAKELVNARAAGFEPEAVAPVAKTETSEVTIQATSAAGTEDMSQSAPESTEVAADVSDQETDGSADVPGEETH